MSIKIMNAVWLDGPDDHAGLLVLLAMADIAGDDGILWPSVATIAAKARMSERNARRVIRILEDDGWLQTNVNRGRNRTSTYRINTDKITGQDNRTKWPGGQNEPENRTKDAGKPDIAVSPEPSGTIIEPSEEPPCVPPSPKSRRRPEVPIPANWTPSDRNLSDAVARQFSAKEIQDEADRFRDHHIARDTRFRDWDAAWRTWLGNARRFGPRSGVAGQAAPGGRGQGRSLASIVAERRLGGAHD